LFDIKNADSVILQGQNMSATSIRRQNGQGAVRMAEATCPTCASPIPREKLDAIIGKLRAHDAEIEHAAEARFALREAAIRKQATAAATAALRERISQAEQAKKAAEEQGKNLKAKQDAMLKARIEAERKAAAKKLEDAINAEKAKAYQEKLKLTGQLGD